MRARARYPRLASILLLATTAAAGFLAGVAWQGGRTPAPKAAAPAKAEGVGGAETEGESRGGPGDRERRGFVIDEIGLAPETRARADGIIRHYRTEMRTLDQEFQEAYRPRHAEIVRRARDSVRSMLTPEQVRTYDSLLAVRYERRGRGGRGRGGMR